MDELVKLMGFKTKNALEYCCKATDHHKTYEILCIAFEGEFFGDKILIIRSISLVTLMFGHRWSST